MSVGATSNKESVETPPPAEELEQALKAEVVDKDHNKKTFGDLVKGKRVAVIFIRHAWCGVCQAYVNKLSRQIPPGNLPEGTEVVIIGCSTSAPLELYIQQTSSVCPIYANPSLSLYKLFKFSYNLDLGDPEDQRQYTSDLGSKTKQFWGSVWSGLKHLEHVNARGPMAQNGGEMIIEKDGSCSFFHRMRNTSDHLELEDLAREIGARSIPLSAAEKAREAENPVSCENGVKV